MTKSFLPLDQKSKTYGIVRAWAVAIKGGRRHCSGSPERAEGTMGETGGGEPGQPQLAPWAAGIFPGPHYTPLATFH